MKPKHVTTLLGDVETSITKVLKSIIKEAEEANKKEHLSQGLVRGKRQAKARRDRGKKKGRPFQSWEDSRHDSQGTYESYKKSKSHESHELSKEKDESYHTYETNENSLGYSEEHHFDDTEEENASDYSVNMNDNSYLLDSDEEWDFKDLSKILPSKKKKNNRKQKQKERERKRKQRERERKRKERRRKQKERGGDKNEWQNSASASNVNNDNDVINNGNNNVNVNNGVEEAGEDRVEALVAGVDLEREVVEVAREVKVDIHLADGLTGMTDTMIEMIGTMTGPGRKTAAVKRVKKVHKWSTTRSSFSPTQDTVSHSNKNRSRINNRNNISTFMANILMDQVESLAHLKNQLTQSPKSPTQSLKTVMKIKAEMIGAETLMSLIAEIGTQNMTIPDMTDQERQGQMNHMIIGNQRAESLLNQESQERRKDLKA